MRCLCLFSVWSLLLWGLCVGCAYAESEAPLASAAGLGTRWVEGRQSRLIALGDDKRALLLAYTAAIKAELSAVPYGTNSMRIVQAMHEIASLIRGVESSDDDWMSGRDASVCLRLRVSSYLILLESNRDLLGLNVYSASGDLLFVSPINLASQRQAIPMTIQRVLQSL